MDHAVEGVNIVKQKLCYADQCRWQASLFYFVDRVALQFICFERFVCFFDHMILKHYHEMSPYFEVVSQLFDLKRFSAF